jgi:hypothetical protein
MTRAVLLPIAFMQPFVRALSTHAGATSATGSPSEPGTSELRAARGAGATR